MLLNGIDEGSHITCCMEMCCYFNADAHKTRAQPRIALTTTECFYNYINSISFEALSTVLIRKVFFTWIINNQKKWWIRVIAFTYFIFLSIFYSTNSDAGSLNYTSNNWFFSFLVALVSNTLIKIERVSKNYQTEKFNRNFLSRTLLIKLLQR